MNRYARNARAFGGFLGRLCGTLWYGPQVYIVLVAEWRRDGEDLKELMMNVPTARGHHLYQLHQQNRPTLWFSLKATWLYDKD